MTESKTPLTSDKVDESTTKVISGKDTTKKSKEEQSDIKKSLPSSSNAKVSKLALFAILISITAPAGHYHWQQLQNKQLNQILNNKIIEENKATLNRYKNQTQQALTNQAQNLTTQLQQVTANINNLNQAKITTLNTKIQQLEQSLKERQPTDWLLHEAEYLIRISSRTLWLEHDTGAAIGLLKDADARLTELNDPAFLPVREIIREDINSLELMPKLDTDEVILALMAMNKQVDQLPLAIVNLGKEAETTNINLSDNINDWQTNLAKTWEKFLNDFIRVRQRTGTVEPLVSPTQQQNLKQNLNLKIQLALWAASERKGDVYQKALIDIQQWLNEFFDMKSNINQHFLNSLTKLQQKQINYNYPSELGSLTAIRMTLKNQQTKPITPVNSTIKSTEHKLQENIEKSLNNTEQQLEQEKRQEEQPENEGNI
jgi:uroporphyrin-3 C-methyltransferase